MNELIDRKPGGWSESSRFAFLAITALALGGCITFLSASNVNLASMIEEKYNDIESLAVANGYDVDAALSTPDLPDIPDTPGAGTVNSLLNEADAIKEFANTTADNSKKIDALNEELINDGLLQQAALNSFSSDLNEFQQSAAWLGLETNKLALVDKEILSYSNYTGCGGSATGDAICAADIASKASSIFAIAGFSIPGAQLALAAFSLGMVITGEVDKAIQRGRLFGERERRITAIQHVANQNLLPNFINLKSNMTSALAGLPDNLQPPGWESALTAAEAEVNQVVDYMNGLDGLFDIYKAEAQANQESLLPGMTPEQMAEMTGRPVNVYRDAEEVAFERLWAEMNEQLTLLESAMTSLTDVKAELERMSAENLSGTIKTVSLKGEEVLEYKTTLLRNDNDTLIQKLARIEEIEYELAGQFSLSSDGISCPLPL